MKRDDLPALAERCEQAKRSSFLLERLIAVAVGYDPQVRIPAYTASLDAAITLVPEGWRIGDLSQHDHPTLRAKGDWTAWLYPDGKLEPVTGDKPRCRFAATPALALTAAALRALAAQEVGA
jgi:hypothetical protein